MERQRQRQIEHYNDRRREVSYEPGQKVWLYAPNLKKGLSKKLLHPWHGPYTIDSQLSPVNYRLKDTNYRRFTQIVHVARLKPFVDPLHRPEQSVDLPETDQFDLDQESLDISGRAEFPGRHLSPGRVMLPDDLPTDPPASSSGSSSPPLGSPISPSSHIAPPSPTTPDPSTSGRAQLPEENRGFTTNQSRPASGPTSSTNQNRGSTSIPSPPPETVNSPLATLFLDLQQIRQEVLNKDFHFNPNPFKQILKTLLGPGSLYIRNSKRNQHFT